MHGRAALLVTCALMAGCGASGSGTKPAARTVATTRPATVQQLIETCKQQVAARDYVPEGAKQHYYKVCGRAASGDAQGVRQVTRDVCVDIEKRAKQFAPAERRQALSNCEAWLKP